ncbi:ZMYND8 [Cervus elaphus hippelaphus]|uniref:ZMYND8 n=1 Tax=Cervus elaphus hippelaphus TaxID=46360 RepID=A0A212CC51_CEREH|nr:ZMYND8 [Cervus elaphus hippelaphus]
MGTPTLPSWPGVQQKEITQNPSTSTITLVTSTWSLPLVTSSGSSSTLASSAVPAACCALAASFFAPRGYCQNTMESETGPEEGSITPGSWILVVSLGLHEGGALGPSSLVG